MTEEKTQIGRLAMRQEGGIWNAYYALNATMDDAILLGSIAIGGIVDNPARREAFLEMMQDMVADIIEDKFGVRPSWNNKPTAAPEHERSGNA
jgi:hypothetical protein